MSNTTKRPITPHKGGRTCRAPEARMTPQERNRLDEVLQRRGVSFADWLAEQVNQGDDTMAQAHRHTIYKSDYKSDAAYRKDYQDLDSRYDYKVKVDDGKGGIGWMFFENHQDYDLWKRTK